MFRELPVGLTNAAPMPAASATPTLRPLSVLSEAERAQALVRFEQLRPALEDSLPLARLARELHLSRRTLQRWARRYRRAGLAGLVRNQRSDRGRQRLHPGLREAIEGLALQRPPRSVALSSASSRGSPASTAGPSRAIARYTR
jgi:AraC-like DNA-binding protein